MDKCNTADPGAGQTASYSNVGILRPGVFNASNGVKIALDSGELERIAANFDPGYLVPTVNIDHRDCGPALGWVEGLSWDGEFLRADIAGVPQSLAGQIDAGAYPGRSAEIYTDLDGRGPSLRAVALLGAQPPAVKGLPPMQRWPGTDSTCCPGPGHGCFAKPDQLTDKPAGQQLSVAILSEVLMDHTTQNPPAETAVALAEENRRLLSENRRLMQVEQQREVSAFIGELRAAGKVTPALEQAGLEQVLLAACEQPLVIQLAEDRSEPLGEALKRIFSALPPSVSFGELESADGVPEPGGLSADERHIAAQLGLTEQEYAEIRRLNT